MILFLVKPRIDRTNLKTITIRATKSHKFDVDIKGEPAPTVTWFHKWKKDEEEVKEDKHWEIVNVEYNSKFSINDALRKHTGIYRILAVNEHGKDEAEVEVNVLSSPSKPGGPLKVTDVTKNSAKVHWKKPEDDGGKPITGYAIEKLDKATGRWVPVGKAGPNDDEFDVRGLQEGHDFQFRVKAINDEGESEPLESSGFIKAKNPFDPPGKPGLPTLEDWDVDRVDLKWEKPKNDGGAPISGYIIEKKEKYSTSWDEIMTTDVSYSLFTSIPSKSNLSNFSTILQPLSISLKHVDPNLSNISP